MKARNQMRYWGIAAAVFVAVLWLLGHVLMPFILGGAIAYFIDPAADRLERAGLSRVAATALITVAGVLIFVALSLSVIPALINQMIDLIEIAPQLLRDLQDFISRRFPSLLDQNSNLRMILTSLGETIRSQSVTVLSGVVGSAMSLVNIGIIMVIVPVVSVYMLLDWDRMIARIDELLPREHAPLIRSLAGEIDATLASFVRGMGMVCLILGTYYAVALMLVGLQFGLVVGFIAGLVTFIPYLGAMIGGILAVGLALFQFWGDWWSIGLVAAIFMFGQVVEGNFLTPMLVGSSVGLHPIWLILALTVFGTMFGFVGMLVAVPVAAALGVVARFAIRQYMEGSLYLGESNPEDE